MACLFSVVLGQLMGLRWGALATLPCINVYTLLADSGDRPSNPPEWLGALIPQLVLLSVAADDYEGRPDPAVLESLVGRNLLRIDRNRWIELTTDGEEMWVEAERK